MKKIILCLVALFTLLGCSYGNVKITKSERYTFQPRPRFRINYNVINDKGENITQEVINNNSDEWLIFTEICDKVKYVLESSEKGYICVNDPYEEVSFIVDIGFSAFYQKRVTEEMLWNLPTATLLPGCDKGETRVHYLSITMLAPLPGLEGLAELWRGETVLEDENEDITVASMTMIEDILKKFPKALR
ncbi:hypothetical protein IKZ40_01475 [bacterium]|nr:hypothetical protein [bacterium]